MIALAFLLSSTAMAGATYDNGFIIETADGDFKLKTNFRLQMRSDLDLVEDVPAEYAIFVARSRIKFTGHGWGKQAKYTVQLGFDKGTVDLKDFYIDLEATDGLVIRMGQFMKPFSRHRNVSNFKTAFVERAFVVKSYSAGRDLGLMLHNGYKRDGQTWAFGVVNGTGTNPVWTGDVVTDLTTGAGELHALDGTNVPTQMHPLVVTHLGWSAEDANGYNPLDLKGGSFRAATSTSAMLDFDTDGGDDGAVMLTGDFVMKLEGVAAEIAVYTQAEQTDGSWISQKFMDVGTHVQASYTIQQKVAPALRYAQVFDLDGTRSQREIGLANTVLLQGHSLKWITEGSSLTSTENNVTDSGIRIRTMFQAVF
jgi:hypothetical protein